MNRPVEPRMLCAERQRLDDDERRAVYWTRWGPYLAERQWGTVREDYSANGDAWGYFSHDDARSRVYRWGEDGLLGISDRECRLCFALSLWNGKDGILKERLYGLTGPEGNHGEDVKELYYYLDATPTASYLKALYKYPQRAFPYEQLLTGSRRRGRGDPELELEDTGVFADGRYFDVTVEYAKGGPKDILVRITCANRGPEPARLDLVPNLWLRNTWAWGRTGDGYWPKGIISRASDREAIADSPSLGRYRLVADDATPAPRLLFTNNETNVERLFGVPNPQPYVKDAFHRLIVDGEQDAVNPEGTGTKLGAWYSLTIEPGAEQVVRLRLSAEAVPDATTSHPPPPTPFGPEFATTFAERQREADEFYALHRDAPLSEEERRVVRQADAGLVWSRQYYHYVVEHWLEGDPAQPPPPAARREVRNKAWPQLWARDVLAMPDTWEYPWFAAWDLAFHCVAMARVDPAFAKEQVALMGREWYMHPNGQLPAYEYSFGDVNPPVHAWAAWRVYQLSAERGLGADRQFLASAFQKAMLNFTWWVNREDVEGDNLFSGGFLGLDNIGVFDRSKAKSAGVELEQADATAWVAFFCSTMLAIALELAKEDDLFADMASKFFEHFVGIASAMNELGGTGLWDDEDGFYYDAINTRGHEMPLRIRSMVGLIPLIAVQSVDEAILDRLPMFRQRIDWFLTNKPDLARSITCMHPHHEDERVLLGIPSRERLERLLATMLDENEFLSPYGIRSMSKVHERHPYVLRMGGEQHEVRYTPGESDSGLFGGNSNWRGPVWFPVNYLLVEALKRYHHFYGDTLLVECPTGSGRRVNLLGAAEEIERRLLSLFVPGPDGKRPCHGDSAAYGRDPHFRDLVLFHEYFHGDTGMGLGASHQTGWTALVANIGERVAMARARGAAAPRVATKAMDGEAAGKAAARKASAKAESAKVELPAGKPATAKAAGKPATAKAAGKPGDKPATSPSPAKPAAKPKTAKVVAAPTPTKPAGAKPASVKPATVRGRPGKPPKK